MIEDEQHTVSEWTRAVAEQSTQLGYEQWARMRRADTLPRDTAADWRCDVRDGETLLGYAEWLAQPRVVRGDVREAVAAELVDLNGIAADRGLSPQESYAPSQEPLSSQVSSLSFYGERYADARAEWERAVARVEHAAQLATP